MLPATPLMRLIKNIWTGGYLMNRKMMFIVTVSFLVGSFTGCQPKTPAEKLKDKVEDATHETGQAVERAGERIKDAAN
jgi:hypothetical protein